MMVILVPIIVYSIINLDKLYTIIIACSFVLMYFVVVFTIYFVGKFFYFPYKEFVYNEETFVMFASKSSFLGYYYDPTFHVVYNCKEYTESGRVMWVGGVNNSGLEVLDDIIFSSIHDLLDWFGDRKFSNFIRIDVKSKQGEMIQCVYKIGMRKFIITKNLEKLSGCFETSRSKYLKNKNKERK